MRIKHLAAATAFLLLTLAVAYVATRPAAISTEDEVIDSLTCDGVGEYGKVIRKPDGQRFVVLNRGGVVIPYQTETTYYFMRAVPRNSLTPSDKVCEVARSEDYPLGVYARLEGEDLTILGVWRLADGACLFERR